jgi:hypothetical protein
MISWAPLLFLLMYVRLEIESNWLIEANENYFHCAGSKASNTLYIVQTSCLSSKARQATEGNLPLPVAISAKLHRKQISRCTLLSAGTWLMSHDVRLFVGGIGFKKLINMIFLVDNTDVQYLQTLNEHKDA